MLRRLLAAAAVAPYAGCDQPPAAAAPATTCDPGTVVLRRLNRAEYDHTIQDLLGDDSRPARAFPDDDIAGGFDNNAAVLAVSPLLFEKHHTAAEQVVAAALAPGAPARERLLVCDPEVDGPVPCARRIVSRFARRAWRRPATDAEVDRLAGFLAVAREQGEGFEQGIALALQAALVSPHFLFRVELDEDPTSPEPHPLSDHELAARMSYFLWSTMPDDELADAADAGALADPAEVERQARRMLAAPRARALVDRFAAQWLGTGSIDHVEPDYRLFPAFDDDLRAAMRAETEAFFAHFLAGGADLRRMLDADFTFANRRLAEHYRVPGVAGAEPRRVALDGTPRRGLLAHAGLLTHTSYRQRTSVVRRGRWVLDKLLCQETPAPPPDVERRLDTADGAAGLRARMERHRADPSCARCHAAIDPIGFALENYDAIGAWRDADAAGPIDPSGALPDGRGFADAAGLAGLLAEDPRFPRCLTRQLAVYGLGRAVTAADGCALNAAAAELAARGHDLRELLVLLVTSEPFRFRRGRPEAEGDEGAAPEEAP